LENIGQSLAKHMQAEITSHMVNPVRRAFPPNGTAHTGH
jgi:hypothetical protein